MFFTKLAVKRKVTILMAVLAVVLLGSVAYSRLPLDLLPEMNFPGAVVITNYDGAAPTEVESIVTRPLEEALGTVSNVRRLSSHTTEGSSVVVAEFQWGTEMDFATLDMREKIDLIAPYFPEGVGKPMVIKFDPSLMPIMYISMTGGDSEVELRSLADSIVKPRLERIEGVASIDIIGGAWQEVAITVDQQKRVSRGIPWWQIIGALRGIDLNLPGGRVTEGDLEYLVRSIGRFNEWSQLQQAVVGMTPQGPVHLEDIANIELATVTGRSLSRLNQQPSVVLSVQKGSQANAVQVARGIEAALDEVAEEIPGQTHLIPTVNQADFIEKALATVSGNALLGGVLAIIILFLFLRNIRTVLLVTLAIPISVISTFSLLHFSGLTLNLMTLSGLALGLGMLVDNSIVVTENIYRHIEGGSSPEEAAISGGGEVAMAITASTLTTIAVFLPVVFVGGIAGTLFKELALTASFALLASLAVAVTFVPMAASVLLRPRQEVLALQLIGDDSREDIEGSRSRRLRRRGEAGGAYETLLEWALTHRLVVVLLMLALMGATAYMLPQIGSEFIPKLDRGEFVVKVDLPSGTRLAVTDSVLGQIEKAIAGMPEVEYITTTIGTGGGSNRASMSGGTETGQVTVRLVAADQRGRSTDIVMGQVEDKLAFVYAPSGTEFSVEPSSSVLDAGNMAPVEIQVMGDSLDLLKSATEDIAKTIQGVEGLTNIETSFRQGKPELQVGYDREALAMVGLDQLTVGAWLSSQIQGERVGSFSLAGEDLPVRVSLAQEFRSGPEDLENLLIFTKTGQALPLRGFATFKQDTGPYIIQRMSNTRMATVTASTTGRDLGSIVNDIQEKLDSMSLPAGVSIAYGGEYAEMTDAFGGLSLAMVLAIVLVYMVMASQFESLLHPFTIMFTIPLAAFGAVAGLFIVGLPFSVPSVIGLIMLAGIVVNNGIVLVDYVNQLRAGGHGTMQALIVAGRTRLRPVLMTSSTTLLALLPMALFKGSGTELARPMAVAVIGGLLTATLLTLVVIPVVYSLFDDLATPWNSRET